LLGTAALPLAVAFTVVLVNGPDLDRGMRHTKAAADILGTSTLARIDPPLLARIDPPLT
jgi:hypothetical protein